MDIQREQETSQRSYLLKRGKALSNRVRSDLGVIFFIQPEIGGVESLQRSREGGENINLSQSSCI